MKPVEQPTVSSSVPHATLLGAFGPDLKFGHPLAQLTSFRTGGDAKYFLGVQTVEEVVRAILAARRLSLQYFVIGGGTNLLVSDEGYDGLVIRVEVTGKSLVSPTEIECGAGESLIELVDYAAENSLAGMEFAAGIWGTVGGAIAGNAGAYGGEIGSVINSLVLVDESGEIKTVGPEYCRFAYRHSRLRETGEVVISARFKLRLDAQKQIRRRVQDILTSREDKHPTQGLSAGCFFRNIPDPEEPHGKLAAGRMLDEVGAKQLRVGGAHVYEKHANIIVNDGNATSKDIRQLADIMKKKVLERFGVELHEEVRLLGRF